ncbi:hypothetical protein PYW07_007246 [Mythimna separata]|uniref:Uncharacterized protein n=1 Tax=Mythimna separata TaxID=271217 RepID=A0AAD8E196_MYTSE|nr:hypothetical protein PYW07_007246 [Mythimna separata]
MSSEELMDTSVCAEAALDSTSSATDFATELRLFKVELRSEFQLMHQEFRQLRTEMAQLKDSLKASDQRVDNLEARLGSLEQRLEQKVHPDRGHLENTIDELRCQLNARDQELLLNEIEVSGVPECKDESALHLVKVLGTKLGVAIDEKDVVHAERVGSTFRNRTSGSISADPTAQRPRNISTPPANNPV